MDELKAANWFCNVGKPYREPDVRTVRSWAEAIASCSSDDWNEVTNTNFGWLVGDVRPHRDRFREWNSLTANFRSIMNPLIEERVASIDSIDAGLKSSLTAEIRSVLIPAYLTFEFSDILDLKERGFFTDIAGWYLGGRFPCGWETRGDSGCLLIY